MLAPPLVEYYQIDDYRKHYESMYCVSPIVTFDSIPVYFRKDKFEHSFFESSKRDGVKDVFSPERARRIEWIKATLQHKDAELYVGWDKAKKRYDRNHRVAVVYNDFVVIIKISRKINGSLKAEFVTAYVADNSIEKIRSAPRWTGIK